MPRQLDQLPTDATTMARKIAALERQVNELRAARRLGAATAGLIQTAASGARLALDGSDQSLSLYADDGTTLLAQIAPETGGGGGFWSRGFQEPVNLSAFMGGGEIRFRTVDSDLIFADSEVLYDSDGVNYADLLLSSGGVLSGDQRAHLLLESVAGGGAPVVYVTGDGANVCNLDVDGKFTAGNLAWGSVAITPSAANTPTSATISGLTLKGSTFIGFSGAQTAAPGSTTGANGVTGTSATSVTSTGLTVWLTRQSTAATTVNWLVIGT